MTEILMPRLSDSMEEGTILKWLKEDGESVKRGEEIAEIETDKASMTYESIGSGILKIVATEGTTLPVGAVIGQLTSTDEKGQEAKLTTKQPQPESEELPADKSNPAPAEPVLAAAPSREQSDQDHRVRVSPLARRLAESEGVDLNNVSGSGPGGRIIKSDIEQLLASPAIEDIAEQLASAEPATDPATEPTLAKGATDYLELTKIQTITARRMAESRATVPDFSVRTEIDMERATQIRSELRDLVSSGKLATAPSLNDLITKACALTLREYPRLNGSYRDGKVELHERVNIGIAISHGDELTVATVPDTDRLALAQITEASKRLVERVRSGEITPPELSGATFTISNLGMFGIDSFNAVINPPQAAILTVGSVKPRPRVVGGEVVARQTVQVELSCDHRIVYGAEAASFLHDLAELLEHPVALIS